MESVPKFIASLITIVIGFLMAISLIMSSMVVNSARTYHSSIIDQIEASNLEDATIAKCIAKSKEDHYEVTITPMTSPETDPSVFYKVTLKYGFYLPILGNVHTHALVGYAVGGARVAIVPTA